jgi:hypothetical protein
MSMPSHRLSNEIDTVFAIAALAAHIVASAAAPDRRILFICIVLKDFRVASGQA